MSELFDTVLRAEAAKRKLEEGDVANLRSFATNVGFVESDNIPDRLQGDREDSAGRGKYQFENDKGSNAAKTAANRLKSWEEKNGKLEISKEEREELAKESPNFAALSEDLQDALFIVNMSLAPKTPLTDIAKGKVPQQEAWVKYHWAGSEKERGSKENLWNRKMLQAKANKAKTFVSSLF